MSQSVVALLVAACVGLPTDAFRGPVQRAGGRAGGFLAVRADLQPQVVAETLVQVEDNWRAQAVAFIACNASNTSKTSNTSNTTTSVATHSAANCTGAPQLFQKSCVGIVGAVLQASSGDRQVVQEYLTEVCSMERLAGWRRNHCNSLAQAITGTMTADSFTNREALDTAGLCRGLWQRVSGEERVRLERERKEQQEREAREAEARRKALEEKKAAEEVARKAAAEKAKRDAEEAARKAAEEAKRLAEEKAKTEAQKAKEEKEAAEKLSADAKNLEEQTAKSIKEAEAVVAKTNATEEGHSSNKTKAAVKPANASSGPQAGNSTRRAHAVQGMNGGKAANATSLSNATSHANATRGKSAAKVA